MKHLLISQDPQADGTDVYAFVSPDRPDTVTLITSWLPFENPAGGPNFYKFGDNVLYEIKIDNTGDAVEDITYQFRFTSQIRNPNTFLYNTGPIRSLDDPNRNFTQTYTVTKLNAAGQAVSTAGPMLTMPDNVGQASTPNYGGFGSGIYGFNEVVGSGLVFAGQTTIRSSSTSACSIFCMAPTSQKRARTALRASTCTRLLCRYQRWPFVDSSPVIGVWATSSRPAGDDALVRYGDRFRKLRAGVPPWKPTRERGCDSGRTKGSLEWQPTGQTMVSLRRMCWTPNFPSCYRPSTGLPRRRRRETIRLPHF